jgi:hypothetical protein
MRGSTQRDTEKDVLQVRYELQINCCEVNGTNQKLVYGMRDQYYQGKLPVTWQIQRITVCQFHKQNKRTFSRPE